MIQNDKVQNEQKQMKPQLQQTENEVFESVSESSGQDQQKQIQAQQDYTLMPIEFPSPQPNTLRLLGIYQQNAQLMSKLKSQISRLSEIKKENLFIKHDCVKMNFQQQESEFFLRSQELYKERQNELFQIKKQIKNIDREQLTTLMSRGLNKFYISKSYFSKFRTIIQAKIYIQELVLLTQQKKKAHQKKKKRNQQEEIIDKLSKSHTRSRSGMKNSQQKIDNVSDNKKNEQDRSDNDSNSNSKISTPRKRDHQKFNSYKRIFNIRFVHLSHLFTQLEQKSNQRQYNCFTIGTKTDTVPRSFAFDCQKKLIFVLFSTNVIYAYGMWSDSQEQIKQQHSVSHKSHRFGHNKLKQVSEFKIEIDSNVQVVFFQLNESTLFLATSDSILRVYQIDFDPVVKKVTSTIKNIIYCLNCDQPLGQIQQMSLGDEKSDEIFFITEKRKLCKLNLNKFKTEIVKRFDQNVLSMGQDFIETVNYIYLYYKQGIYQYFPKEKNDVFEGYDEKESLKKCSLIKDDKIFFIKVDKHGLLKGFSDQI